MTDPSPALIEITREAPCDGRREELLSLAALRDDARTSPAARRHLRTCRRCKAFLRSVQGELRLARDAFTDLRGHDNARSHPPRLTATDAADPAGVRLAALPTSRAFDRWLDRQLRDRTELQLAEAMTRTARSLFHLDAAVGDRAVSIDSTPSRQAAGEMNAGERAQALLREFASRSTTRLGVAASTARRAAEAAENRALENQLRTLLCINQPRDAAIRLLARSLVDRALDLTDRKSGSAWLMQSMFAWFDDKQGNVEELLLRASNCANEPNVAASVLLNLALLRSTATLGPETMNLLSRALECQPSRSLELLIRGNRALWLGALGQNELADRDLHALRRPESVAVTRRHFGVGTIQRIVASLSTHNHVPKSRETEALRRTIEAIHGQ